MGNSVQMLRDGNEGMSTIPGFNQIQFEGFCRFIDQSLTEELDKFPKIEDTDEEIEFQLFVETYKLAEALIKEEDAVYESLTYSSELYVSAGLFWKTSREMQEQTILIGNIPLMNSLGTFLVNGIYRIVINQLLQSPGIYYRSELDHNGISVYTGTIISDWGGRSELEIDGNNYHQIIDSFEKAKEIKNKPTLILANTIKGKGISFMENKASWHHGVITDEQYQTCLKELEEAKNEQNI